MNTPFDVESATEGTRIVYVRPVSAADLPDDVLEQTGGSDDIFGVHAPNGDRLALVKGRQLAFRLARDNDFTPVDAH